MVALETDINLEEKRIELYMKANQLTTAKSIYKNKQAFMNYLLFEVESNKRSK